MIITIKEINNRPTMKATKGNVSFIYSGMCFLLDKVIIKLESATVDGKPYIEITDGDMIMKLQEKIFTEDELDEMYEAIKEY